MAKKLQAADVVSKYAKVRKESFMKIDARIPSFSSQEGNKSRTEQKGKNYRELWEANKSSQSSDPYDLDINTVIKGFTAKDRTGSVTCPPCNETNNSCHGTQCCTGNCSGNPNCS